MADSLHLVFGDDTYRVAERARALLASLAPGTDAMSREVIEGDAATVDETVASIGRCEEALQTAGLFASRKVVWFRDPACLLPSTGPGKSERVKERLARFVEFLKRGLPSGQILVVTATAVDKRSAFYKVFKAAGTVDEFSKPAKVYLAEQEATALAQACFRDAGIRLSADGLAAFMERVGTDSGHIASEAAKLATYLGDAGTGAREDVQAVTSPGREAMGWDLADALGERDLPRALGVLRQLLFQREAPMRLIMAITSRLGDLCLYREAIDRGWLRRVAGRGANVQAEWKPVPAAVDAVLGGMKRDPRKTHPYRVGLLARQANRYSQEELAAARRSAVAAHERLVSGSAPADAVLELLLIRVVGGAGGR